MNKHLKELFTPWNVHHRWSKEADKVYNILCGQSDDVRKVEECENLMMEAVEQEHAAAFSAGFYTAVELLSGNK